MTYIVGKQGVVEEDYMCSIVYMCFLFKNQIKQGG